MEGKVMGIGGVFFKFNDPTKMKDWYKNVLGMTTNDYGVLFTFNTPNTKPAYLQLGTFESNSEYFGSESQKAMINFRVDNMEMLVKKLKANNVSILNEIEDYDYGRFLHISDPEGNRIELWEPIDVAFSEEPKTVMF